MVRLEKLEYSENRRRPEKAASYNVKYERELHKRISDWREKRILEGLLARAGQCARVLDVPCGAGRLSGIIARHAEKLYEVDYSREMLHLCRSNATAYRPFIAAASAFQLPFPDGAFDLAVSIRLSHHIPTREARHDHLREVLRVARRFALVTYFGEESMKNRLRNLYRRLGGKKRAKWTLGRREVEALAAAAGFRVVRVKSISSFFSGHFFTLLERSEGETVRGAGNGSG
ncbi:MAG TPA: class I SAM-dependent methyltransferase [Planctomycetota bacterium]|nr:class I SAM-dependent methyltransferase [Planctomycetota bacterium]